MTASAQLATSPALDQRFLLVETLGQGGQGRVFRAYDRVFRRDVAIKALHESRAAIPFIPLPSNSRPGRACDIRTSSVPTSSCAHGRARSPRGRPISFSSSSAPRRSITRFPRARRPRRSWRSSRGGSCGRSTTFIGRGSFTASQAGKRSRGAVAPQARPGEAHRLRLGLGVGASGRSGPSVRLDPLHRAGGDLGVDDRRPRRSLRPRRPALLSDDRAVTAGFEVSRALAPLAPLRSGSRPS